jgi:excisionase family DNA binding protein
MTPEAGTSTEATLLIDAAARRIGVSRRTVYYWIRDGRLRTIRTRGGSLRVLASSIDKMRRGARTQIREAAPRALHAEPLPLEI